MNDGSLWDSFSTPIKWIVGVTVSLYFGGGLIAPFFWVFK